MYLKSLQLTGFKSFAEKTVLDFLPGVTAIVGPNGCGKSNIADAIRWVLGEQSAKVLRGNEMSDVIFNGADGRKPIGMAEVNMTFAECDPKHLSLPGINLDFSEVTITRRVYRDGAGEYLINKTPCRLRDIQNLFMDTGIGRSSYSLMAQGQIDQILSAHPEDRRMIFEEAAGINKYKHQKKEALRKLEYTEANLVRLTDIIKEVKRQIISLQRQAGKARRYKELFDQLKAVDTRLSRRKYDLIQREISGLEKQISEFTTQSQRFATEIADCETQIDALRQSLSEIERAIADATNRDHELKSETERHQQRVGSNTERIAEFEELIENNRRETAGSEEKIHVQEQELARLNAEFAQIDTSLAAEQSKLQTQQAALDRLNVELSDKTRALKEINDALVACESERARAHNDLGALDARKKSDLLRAERLSTEQLSLEDQRRALEQRLKDFDSGVTELRASIEPLRAELAARESKLVTINSELAAAAEQHHASATEVSRRGARLELLRQMFTAPDGKTMLGNILEVEPEYNAAIEAALSHNRRTILADDLDTARALLASEPNNPSVATPELLPGAPGITEKPDGGVNAASIVRVKDKRFAPLVSSLLQNVVIVDDLNAALAFRIAHPSLAAATRHGEFVSEHGILSAVSAGQVAEIKTLSDEIGKLETRTADSATRRNELEQKKAELETAVSQSRAELHDKEVVLATKQGEADALATEHRDLEGKVHTVVFELTGIEQQDTEDKSRRTELLRVLQQTETRLNQLRDEQNNAQRAVDELQAQKEQCTQQLTEQRVAVGGVEHKRSSISSQLEPIAGHIRDLRERMQTCTSDIDNHTTRIEQLRQEITESEQKAVELGASRGQSQQQLAGLQHQRGEVATGIQHAEDELRTIRKRATGAQEQKSSFDVTLAQKRMEMQNLKDRVWQKYQANLDEVRSDAITITVADQGAAVSQQVPLQTDWDAIEQQAAEMQSKLDAMGPVNVEAINEYDELDQRHNFLTQQHDDLVRAKEQLLQVIAKINTTTKQLFSETFEKVRINFQAMFAELFGGGKANLLLVDENDPLESGIEIVAKPPGKQLQSITLLSGGEKTLTATALLFSIYMVKPSPFCVLDELDAPLDESNINRFVRILQRFITQSQFVIITHSKRTIGMADALYGITMEDHGISKIVSVKFSPREETERKQREQAREVQEERIDGAAVAAADLRPHEEPLTNELLSEKEGKLTPVTDTTPIDAPEPTLGQAAPESLKAEVQAAVAAAEEVSESVKQTVAEAGETDTDKSGSSP